MSYAELLQQFASAEVTPATSENCPAVTDQSLVQQGGILGIPGSLSEQQTVTIRNIKANSVGSAETAAAIGEVCRDLTLSPARLRQILSDDDCKDIAEGYTSLSTLRKYAQLMLEPDKDWGAKE